MAAENAVRVVGGGVVGFAIADPRQSTVAVAVAAGPWMRCPEAPKAVEDCFPGDLAG